MEPSEYDVRAEYTNHCGRCNERVADIEAKLCGECDKLADSYRTKLTKLSGEIDDEIDYARKSRMQRAYSALLWEACEEIPDFEEVIG